MSKTQGSLQDLFLNEARKTRALLTVYLGNGFQLKGVVKGFDNFTFILDTDGKQQLIYKHAVSTMTPFKPLNIKASGEDDAE